MSASPTNTQKLRQGFSTGACVTAVITAAWAALREQEKRVVFAETKQWEVLFPDGKRREIKLAHTTPGFCSLIKDGGDDPDCTHGAEVHARLRRAEKNEATDRDYLLPIGDGWLILRAVEGIGLCTRPGLDCEQGHWAINPGPRRMISENLLSLGFGKNCFLAEIGIKNGEQLAKKTLNAQLGVLGGLSILGTSGLVRPFSHEAYIQTIRICLRALKLEGEKEVVFCTGGRTQSTARKHLTTLPETAFVCMGDFLGDSLRAARDLSFERVTIACMPGKLCKYAAGFDNTHAHKVDQDIPLFLRVWEELSPVTKAEKDAISACASVRQALEHVSPDLHIPLFRALSERAFAQFRQKTTVSEEHSALPASPLFFRLLVCHFDGTLLLDINSDAPPQTCL